MLVPLAGKFAGAFVGTYVTRIDAPFALAAGLMSKGVAEIAFLLVLLESGTIEKDVFSLLVLIMFGYILHAGRNQPRGPADGSAGAPRAPRLGDAVVRPRSTRS